MNTGEPEGPPQIKINPRVNKRSKQPKIDPSIIFDETLLQKSGIEKLDKFVDQKGRTLTAYFCHDCKFYFDDSITGIVKHWLHHQE